MILESKAQVLEFLNICFFSWCLGTFFSILSKNFEKIMAHKKWKFSPNWFIGKAVIFLYSIWMYIFFKSLNSRTFVISKHTLRFPWPKPHINHNYKPLRSKVFCFFYCSKCEHIVMSWWIVFILGTMIVYIVKFTSKSSIHQYYIE